MTSWNDVDAAAPELARLVRARFEAHGLGVLATLRRDGSPRVSGLEPLFAEGELWLGMMPASLKSRDLRRDPRFALHNATVDKNVTGGDAKISGRAVPVLDDATVDLFREAFARSAGSPPPPGPMDLYRAEVESMSFLVPEGGDHLVIEQWSATTGHRRVEVH